MDSQDLFVGVIIRNPRTMELMMEILIRTTVGGRWKGQDLGKLN